MTVTEQLLYLASLEQDGKAKIPGLRETCPVRPLPTEIAHRRLNTTTGTACLRCQGRGWLPVAPQDAAWALAHYYDDFLINSAGAWVWPEIDSNGYYGRGEFFWESLIDAAYKAEIGEAE
jgi:hypothetical protein